MTKIKWTLGLGFGHWKVIKESLRRGERHTMFWERGFLKGRGRLRLRRRKRAASDQGEIFRAEDWNWVICSKYAVRFSVSHNKTLLLVFSFWGFQGKTLVLCVWFYVYFRCKLFAICQCIYIHHFNSKLNVGYKTVIGIVIKSSIRKI